MATKARSSVPGARATKPTNARLLTLGALAASAGLTAAQLKRIAEMRRLQELAREMRREGAALRAWSQSGADPGSVPPTSALLDAWLAEPAETGLAGPELAGA